MNFTILTQAAPTTQLCRAQDLQALCLLDMLLVPVYKPSPSSSNERSTVAPWSARVVARPQGHGWLSLCLPCLVQLFIYVKTYVLDGQVYYCWNRGKEARRPDLAGAFTLPVASALQRLFTKMVKNYSSKISRTSLQCSH